MSGVFLTLAQVVLAVRSKYFSSLFTSEAAAPMVFLRGVEGAVLEALVEFMYQGEVVLAPAILEQFFALGNELGVGGLEQGEEQGGRDREGIQSPSGLASSLTLQESTEVTAPAAPTAGGTPPDTLASPSSPAGSSRKRRRSSAGREVGEGSSEVTEACVPDPSGAPSRPSGNSRRSKGPPVVGEGSEVERRDTKEVLEVVVRMEAMGVVAEGSEQAEQFAELVSSLVEKAEDGGITCAVCGKMFKTRQHATGHVEAHHLTCVSHKCKKCGVGFKSRQSLAQHKMKKHQG